MDETWPTKQLAELADVIIGRTPPRAEPRFWTKDLTRPFCTITDMTRRMVAPSREGVTEEAEAAGKARRVPAGSLLMSFKLTIGKVGFAAVDLFPNEAIAWLRCDSDLMLDEYLACWISVSDFRRYSGRAAKGKTLNKASMQVIEVEVPPLDVQAAIVAASRELDRLEEAAASVARDATVARTSILRAAIGGDMSSIAGASE